MNSKSEKHIVVVEAYEGFLEFLSDEPEDRKASQGLGLPLEEIAERLDCRMTVFSWDEWLRYELSYGSPFTWVAKPVTRPTSPSAFSETESVFDSRRIRRVPLPAQDPVFCRPFSETGLSPNSHGLIANNDLMFFVSYCLREHLNVFRRQDRFQAVILPMWGGLGYLSQLARATGARPALDVPFVVVASSTSARRYEANQEGRWTLEATIRRQMEDVSLALADEVIVFGPQGASIAREGRLLEGSPPIVAPRRVADDVLGQILESSEHLLERPANAAFFLNEPQQAAAGVLAVLDAVALLGKRGFTLQQPVISAGPPMIFGPMKPRDFQNYWSSRGFVREMLERRQWCWERNRPRLQGALPVRLYPSLFEHLPNVWTELAKGSLVLLSPAAAEGLAPGETMPEEILLNEEPTAQALADGIQFLEACDRQELDLIRRKVCSRVVAAHRGQERESRLAATVASLDRILQDPPAPQDLSRIAILLLDRRRSLGALASSKSIGALRVPHTRMKSGSLSVVVTCYDMGPLITQAVESVWSSDRVPDELVLVNDGSRGEETLEIIKELERAAAARHLPLQVIHQGNMGLAGARNSGLAAVSSEFVSVIDGDDLIDRRFYDLALRLMEKHPGLGGVAAWAYCFNERGVVGFWNAPQPELPLAFIDNGVIVPCLMQTEVLRSLGGYDVNLRYNYEDWELSIRMLASGRPIIIIPAYLMKYRERTDSLFRSMTEVQNQIMRERLFASHRETVSRFGVEIAMLLENRLMRRVYAEEVKGVGDRRSHWLSGGVSSGQPGPGARIAFAQMLRYLRRRIRIRTPGDAGDGSIDRL
jgi:glycosyltransferase involved in cell wall biosynthesis